MRKCIFLDRDGVLLEDKGKILKKSDIIFLDGIHEALRNFNQLGYMIILITNQPLVGRGYIDEIELRKLHDYISNNIKKESGILIDDIFYCPHHPSSEIEKYSISCNCRKPKPGMILDASLKHDIDIKESWMIGDQKNDILAGKLAGCKTIMIKSEKNNFIPLTNKETNYENALPDLKADNLVEASRMIKDLFLNIR